MKLAIITGGSKGLGESLVQVYSRSGFRVIEFSRSGRSGFNVKCDFSDPDEAAEVVEKRFSTLNNDGADYSEIILVNNVGTIEPIGPISNFKTEYWIRSININLISSIITTGIFIKNFQNHSCIKTIANISSGAASKSRAGWSLYCTAKSGLEMFCNSVAKEQETQKNPVNIAIINPGVMDTAMQEVIRASDSEAFPEHPRFLMLKRDGKLASSSHVAERIFEILAGPISQGAKYTI